MLTPWITRGIMLDYSWNYEVGERGEGMGACALGAGFSIASSPLRLLQRVSALLSMLP